MATSEQYNTQKYENEHRDFAEACDEIRKKYRVSRKLTKKDLVDFPRGKVGDIITMNPPIPDNTHDAFELFKNYYAAIQFELQKFLFIEKYKIWNKASVTAEIKEIENWTEEAKKKNYANAVKPNNGHVSEYQYLLLLNGYYDGYLMTWQQHQENSFAAAVYGRYFLFYDYLKEKLSKLQYSNSQYVQKIEIDFEDLPTYVVEQGILQRFEKLHDIIGINTQELYSEWIKDWQQWLRTIPEQYIVKTVQKGIEYGKKVYDYYLHKEKNSSVDSIHAESWQRRIALAENFMNGILRESKPTRKDFSNWIMGKPDWSEIAWRYNTGRQYQAKQDLVAVFWNSYVYFQQKFEVYYQEFQVIPTDYFQKLIFEFRQKFPKSGRVEGINYFDDLIEQLIERYEKVAIDNIHSETINEQPESTAKNKDFTTARQVLVMHFIFEQLQVRGTEIDRTAKAEIVELLTGKNYKNIYDALQDPFITKQKKFRFDDLQYIRTYFEKLGLSEIVKAINNQLDKPR